MPSPRASIGIAVFAALLVATPLPAAAGQQRAASPADYAGEDACLSCHPTQSYKGTAHALATNLRTPAATHGCESCHGPGKGHVDGGGDTTKIVNPGTRPLPEANDVCGTCHARGTHPAVAGTAPDPRQAACTTCHSVHAAKGRKLLKQGGAGL